jgi:glucose/arabinose dehydrogenase
LRNRSPAPLALLAAAVLGGCGSSASSPTGVKTAPLVSIGAGLRGPAGLHASVYARGVPNVAAITFDAQGRLWATAAGLTGHRRDGVYLITRPRAQPVRVISGLKDPLGLVWHGGRLYVSSVGRVTVYRGFDGTRFAHQQTIIHGPVAGGENNNLVLLPDGRFAMGITATCDHCLPRSEFSGSIVTFAPDGSDLKLYAARIRAPVGLTLYPGTSELFVTMNQRDDLGAKTTGDVLAVVAPGTDWRSPQCYEQGGAVCAGVPKPLAVLDKHAAVGPVVIVTGQLGSSTGTAALVSEWQSAKVQRITLVKRGSSYTGAVSTWLTGLHNPLALALGPQRSVLVGDWGTGTIYRITHG